MPELVFILVLALLIFGPKRLPQVGRTLGKGLREFRQATNELKRTVETEISAVDAEPLRPTPAPLPAPKPALETETSLENETSKPVSRSVSAPAAEPVAGGDVVEKDTSKEAEAEVKEAVAAAGEAPTGAWPTD